MHLNEINKYLQRLQQSLRHNKTENDKVLHEINKFHHQIDLRFSLLTQYYFELPKTRNKTLRIIFNYSLGEQNKILIEKVNQLKKEVDVDYFIFSETILPNFEDVEHYRLTDNWSQKLIPLIMSQGYENVYIFIMSTKVKNWLPLFQNKSIHTNVQTPNFKQTITSLELIQKTLMHSYLIQVFNTVMMNNSFLRYKNKLVSLDEGKKKIEKKMLETNSLKFKVQREMDLENHIMISKNQELMEL